jgi:hypothetical protein
MRFCRVVFTLALLSASPAFGQTIESVYTQVDAGTCPHSKSAGIEAYGSWRCTGHEGMRVLLSAGDQRMFVSFGPNAAAEPAAEQTFPAFNNVYKGTIEWRLEKQPGGTPRAFATILRWNVKLENDERESTGRVLVVTRLGPGGVCHVGYVDARANPNANELARRIADENARTFQCGKDRKIVLGTVGPGLAMPER